MISTMTAALQAALSGDSRRPRQLLEIHFPASGIIYLSDQPMGVADGLDHDYLPLVEDWGSLSFSTGDSKARDNGLIRQCSITFWNGGTTPLSDHFIANPVEATEVLHYQWAMGLTEADKFLIDRFRIADPIAFDEASRLLTLDLVSLPYLWDVPVGNRLLQADWPYADPADIGAAIPVALGSPGRIKGLKARVAKGCTLASSVLTTTTTLDVQEDLDTLGLPPSGALQIVSEIVNYTGRTAHSFTGCTRGSAGSEAAQHLRGTELVEHISDHTFVFCEGPVSVVTSVQVKGYPAPDGIYTVDAAANPARVVFSEQPYYERFSAGSRFYEMQFDSTGAGNTALWPTYAYDEDETATGALISYEYPALVITQTDTNTDQGQIRKVYLSVAAFTVGWYAVDRVNVEVSGLGVIGQLTRPDSADQVGIDGEVDVDHGHLHSTGAAHYHSYTGPSISTNNASHAHSSSLSGVESIIPGTIDGYGAPTHIYAYNVDVTKLIVAASPAGTVSRQLSIKGSNQGVGDVTIYVGGTVFPVYQITYAGSFDTTINCALGYDIYIKVRKAGVVNGNCYIERLNMICTASAGIDANVTGVQASVTNPGSVAGQGADNNDDPIKAYDDVHDLAEAGNRSLLINATDNPSRTIVDLFDLTPAVNFDWLWFTGRTVTLRYVNTGDENKDVYILHAHFQIEFAPKEIVYSDDISAEIVAARTTPAESIEFLLTAKAGTAGELLDDASFSATAASHSALNYQLDGLLPGDVTVREAIKNICRQTHSRLFTSAGLVRLVEKTITPPITKALIAADGDLQLRSITINKQPLTEISNRIDLAYDYDQYGDAGYKATVRAENADSVSNYGLRYLPDNYQFDLIRDADMAAKVAAYYLAVDGQPATWYTFNAYLPQLTLEPEDGIQLTANFHGLTATPLVVRCLERRFGSGKNGQINLITITAEKHNYDEADIFSVYAAFAPEILPTEVGDVVNELDHLANIDLSIL
jgi:hypothetical protein